MEASNNEKIVEYTLEDYDPVEMKFYFTWLRRHLLNTRYGEGELEISKYSGSVMRSTANKEVGYSETRTGNKILSEIEAEIQAKGFSLKIMQAKYSNIYLEFESRSALFRLDPKEFILEFFEKEIMKYDSLEMYFSNYGKIREIISKRKIDDTNNNPTSWHSDGNFLGEMKEGTNLIREYETAKMAEYRYLLNNRLVNFLDSETLFKVLDLFNKKQDRDFVSEKLTDAVIHLCELRIATAARNSKQ